MAAFSNASCLFFVLFSPHFKNGGGGGGGGGDFQPALLHSLLRDAMRDLFIDKIACTAYIML